MIITKLELIDFRNYENLNIELSDGVNIISGDNAQGKTNILEAIYMCSTTRALRATHERELIRFGCEEAHIRMYIEKNGVEHRVDMHLKKNKPKGVAIDGMAISKSSELYGMTNIISFSPDDLSMIKNGPAERRKFLDMELCQIDKSYLYNLSGYNRALLQRNNLLKQITGNRSLTETLQIWDDQLVSFGNYLIDSRRRYIGEIFEIAGKIHKGICPGEEIGLKYVPSCSEANFGEQLFINRDRDIMLGTTGCGPHRDDMEISINGSEARKYGSQGQQRTAALTLKLAEIELVRQKAHTDPVLLLDDVLSELDRGRQTQLLNSIEDIQTVITCTGLEEFVNDRKRYNKIYRVEKGNLTIVRSGERNE